MTFHNASFDHTAAHQFHIENRLWIENTSKRATARMIDRAAEWLIERLSDEAIDRPSQRPATQPSRDPRVGRRRDRATEESTETPIEQSSKKGESRRKLSKLSEQVNEPVG